MTFRPVTTNSMTFDGKSEKFELFEDLFHTMIEMQPAMTEQPFPFIATKRSIADILELELN